MDALQKNVELTKRMMDSCIGSLMKLRRLDEVTNVMDTKTFDAMLDEICKEKWEKYSEMSKSDIIVETLMDITT